MVGKDSMVILSAELFKWLTDNALDKWIAEAPTENQKAFRLLTWEVTFGDFLKFLYTEFPYEIETLLMSFVMLKTERDGEEAMGKKIQERWKEVISQNKEKLLARDLIFENIARQDGNQDNNTRQSDSEKEHPSNLHLYEN